MGLLQRGLAGLLQRELAGLLQRELAGLLQRELTDAGMGKSGPVKLSVTERAGPLQFNLLGIYTLLITVVSQSSLRNNNNNERITCFSSNRAP